MANLEIQQEQAITLIIFLKSPKQSKPLEVGIAISTPLEYLNLNPKHEDFNIFQILKEQAQHLEKELKCPIIGFHVELMSIRDYEDIYGSKLDKVFNIKDMAKVH